MRKPWLREVKFFAQGCTACKINSKPCICPIVMCCFVINCWTFLLGCWAKYLPLYELVLLPTPENPLAYWRMFVMKHLKAPILGLGLSFYSTESL